jgi:NTP pyrophosphatase (non-canonical NTP hydrolase)
MEKICKNCLSCTGFKTVDNEYSCNILKGVNPFQICKNFKPKKPDRKQIINQFLIELQKAEEKHPNWPKELTHQALILAEEAGEIAKAALHIIEGKGTLEELKEEIYQTGAMCIRLAENL